MRVKLLQDDLRSLLDNQLVNDGGKFSALTFAGRHRLGTGGLAGLPFGKLTLDGGKPVTEASNATIDRWFSQDADWQLPSRRNLAGIAQMFSLGWPEALHLQLKCEWERFLTDTQPEAGSMRPAGTPFRIAAGGQSFPYVLRKPELPLQLWPARAFRRPSGELAPVEDYRDAVQEFLEAWLPEQLDGIVNEIHKFLPVILEPAAFRRPDSGEMGNPCYYILTNFVTYHDIHRISIFAPVARQFHATLNAYMLQWQSATPQQRAECAARLEKWHAAGKDFDLAAVQLETARQIHQQIETRWFAAFGTIYGNVLEAFHRKEKLRKFMAWLRQEPGLSERDLEQRYAEESGAKDRAEADALATRQAALGLSQAPAGEGASDEEIAAYFSDMKRMYRSIAWLTHPDRYTDEVPGEIKGELTALWMAAASLRNDQQPADATLRRAELRRLIQRARDLRQQANLPVEEKLIPTGLDLPSTTAALIGETAGLESDARRVREEVNSLGNDPDFLNKTKDLDPEEAIPGRLEEYRMELEQLKSDIATAEAAIAALR